jgi:hypothetical protein
MGYLRNKIPGRRKMKKGDLVLITIKDGGRILGYAKSTFKLFKGSTFLNLKLLADDKIGKRFPDCILISDIKNWKPVEATELPLYINMPRILPEFEQVLKGCR